MEFTANRFNSRYEFLPADDHEIFITTTDGAPTTAVTIPLEYSSTKILIAKVTCYAATIQGTWTIKAMAHRLNIGDAILDSTLSLKEYKKDIVLNADFSASGAAILLIVTGKPATTLTWRGYVEVI